MFIFTCLSLALTATPTPAEEAARLELAAFVDTYYAFNTNEPYGRVSFVPGTGSTAKRSGELSLNLAGVVFALEPQPVGGRISLVAGTSTDIIHAGEPLGVGIGPDVFRYIYEAYGSVAVPGVDGLVVDVGVFPCHVGFEAFFSKDNWNYTRSWLAEFSPYYSAGLRTSYAITDSFSAQLHLVNGWQTIGDVNLGKTLGTQLAYDTELLTISLNGLFGPELPGDNRHWRVYGDLVLVVRPLSWLSFGASADIARQALPGDRHVVWHGAVGYLRLAPTEWIALAARGGYFADPDAGISGAEQTLSEGTVTLEWRPVPSVIVKAEGRYDRSTKPVFTDRGAEAGAPNTTDSQLLAVLGTVVSF